MAERARAKNKVASKKGGEIKSRGTVAELPKSALRTKGNKHNGPPAGLTDDQIADWQEKLDRQFKKVTDAQDEVKHANGVYRAMLKTAKKEGFDPEAYIEARDMDREDHGHVQVRFANVGRYLRVRGSNLATQMELFQDIAVQAAPDEAPAVKGLKAGRAGNRRDENPYKPGSEEHEAYDSNWLTGQKEIAEGMRPEGSAVN